MRKKSRTTQVLALCLGILFIAGCGSGGSTGAGIGALAGAGYMVGNEADKKKAQRRTDAEMAAVRAEMSYVTVNMTNSNSSISQAVLPLQQNR